MLFAHSRVALCSAVQRYVVLGGLVSALYVCDCRLRRIYARYIAMKASGPFGRLAGPRSDHDASRCESRKFCSLFE